MADTPWLDDREAAAWRGFLRMQMHLDAALARQLAADSGLSHQDYGVLVALSEAPEGRVRLFELAELLGWEKSRASHHVSRMANRGLVDKEPCDEDRIPSPPPGWLRRWHDGRRDFRLRSSEVHGAIAGAACDRVQASRALGQVRSDPTQLALRYHATRERRERLIFQTCHRELSPGSNAPSP